MILKGIKRVIKNALTYFKDDVENIYYEEVMNEYGSEQSTKEQIKKYVKKLKKEDRQ